METIEKIILNDVITECRIKAMNEYLKSTKLPIRILRIYDNEEIIYGINNDEQVYTQGFVDDRLALETIISKYIMEQYDLKYNMVYTKIKINIKKINYNVLGLAIQKLFTTNFEFISDKTIVINNIMYTFEKWRLESTIKTIDGIKNIYSRLLIEYLNINDYYPQL